MYIPSMWGSIPDMSQQDSVTDPARFWQRELAKQLGTQMPDPYGVTDAQDRDWQEWFNMKRQWQNQNPGMSWTKYAQANGIPWYNPRPQREARMNGVQRYSMPTEQQWTAYNQSINDGVTPLNKPLGRPNPPGFGPSTPNLNQTISNGPVTAGDYRPWLNNNNGTQFGIGGKGSGTNPYFRNNGGT